MDDRVLVDPGRDIETMPHAAVLVDLRRRALVAVNRRAAELIAAPASDVIGSDALDFVDPDDRPSAMKAHLALADGAVDGMQVARRMLRSDGSTIHVAIWARRVAARDQQLGLYVLTPQTPNPPPLIATGSAPNFVLAVTDHDWLIEYVSADATLLGGPGRGLIGMPLLGFVHPSVAQDFLAATSRVVSSRLVMSFTTRLQSGPGEWVDRHCLLAAMCEHRRPRLGVVVAATMPNGNDHGRLDGDVRDAQLDVRGARALAVVPMLLERADAPELSARQIEVLAGAVEGRSVADIAASVHLSASTVRNHLTAIYRKFGVHSRAELLARLLRAE